MKSLLFIAGTRPEIIKIAPLVLAFEQAGLRQHILVMDTGQSADLNPAYWKTFGITPDFQTQVMTPGQSLSQLLAILLQKTQAYLSGSGFRWGGILAQGDTATALAAAMTAFLNQIPFIHLEAGLRSNNIHQPYPEEYNRKVIALSATCHLAPTKQAADNLRQEGVKDEQILITGNTVVDALQILTRSPEFKTPFDNEQLQQLIVSDQKLVLITCHRRENQGHNLLQLIETVQQLANLYPDYTFVWPVHPNPNIFQPVWASGLQQLQNVWLLPALGYLDLLRILSKCSIALSDSGGIQEEAPSFGVPLLVLRDTTERPEGILAGCAVLTGTEPERIIPAFRQYISKSRILMDNPYGDGKSSMRIIEHLKTFIHQ